MKISHRWLHQFLPTTLEPTTIAELLTSGGLEVEHVVPFCPIPGSLQGLLIGEVVDCGKHPDADRLSVTTVSVGADQLLNIVCGAPNVAAGQKVVVAPVGVVVHPSQGEPFEIKKAKIRGQLSEGMICAEDEIGLGNSHDGILVLPPDAPVGELASNYFKISNDFVYEIGLTPNRTDAMSHLGVARDLRALVRSNSPEIDVGNIQWPDIQAFKPELGKNPIEVVVADVEAAPRYVGVYIRDLKVAQSPKWLHDALQSIGLRPINNIVDVTNYVLHSIGQPLHAFDADKIEGEKVIVRMAVENEEFVTLDGVNRKLHQSDLMICNTNGPMCMAGVFGGMTSGVSEGTTSIFLESAFFNPSTIRKAAKRHGLSTDASFRFERGVDPETAVYAAKWAALLIQQVAGGAYSEVFDSYPNPLPHHKVTVSHAYLCQLVGQDIDIEVVKSIFSDLEIAIDRLKDGVFDLLVPTYRFDVTRPADVVEEVLRIYGYDRVGGNNRVTVPIGATHGDNGPALREIVANKLATLGFNEMMANSLMPAAMVETHFPDFVGQSVAVLNALSSDLNVLRQDLVFGGLEAVARNIRYQRPNLKLFEFGSVYFNVEDADWPFHEEESLSLMVTGRAFTENWSAPNGDFSFHHLKGVIDALLASLGLKVETDDLTDKPSPFAYGLRYMAGQTEVVRLGAVRSELLKTYDIDRAVFYADLRFTLLTKAVSGLRVKVKELPKYPFVTRDLALLIGKDVAFKQLRTLAVRAGKGLVKSVDLFDVYEGKGLPEGKRSYAIRLILQDENATLTDTRIEEVMGRVLRSIQQETGADLRA